MFKHSFTSAHTRVLTGAHLSFLVAMCRVRISLGLKPLSMETEKEQRQKEAAAREAKRAEQEKEAKAAELAEKVKTYVSPNMPLNAHMHTLVGLISGSSGPTAVCATVK